MNAVEHHLIAPGIASTGIKGIGVTLKRISSSLKSSDPHATARSGKMRGFLTPAEFMGRLYA